MHHIVVKVIFLQTSWLHILIGFRINIYMKKHRLLFSKSPMHHQNQARNTAVTSHLKGKSPIFWSWTFGNFGYSLSVIAAWACPNFDQGDQHRKQRKMLNPVFSTAHMRKMSTYSSLFLDNPTHWCASPDILWRLLQGTTRLICFYFAVSYSNIIWSKASRFLCSSSQRWTTRSS